MPRHRLVVPAAIAALCWLAGALTIAHQAPQPPSRYLFTWVGHNAMDGGREVLANAIINFAAAKE